MLSHLNQQRENFRDHFPNICFVFIVPLFALKYFIRRAPDFFDWRSGVFEFPMEAEQVEQASLRILQEGNYEKYKVLTPPQRTEKLLEIQALLEERHQTPERKAELYREQGLLFDAAQDYSNAIESYDQALAIKPDDHEAWNKRGIVLARLERYEAAIDSFDKALEFKPDYHYAWYSRGLALRKLGRYEEAIDSYDKALAIKPDYDSAWYGKACCYGLQRDVEQAINYLQTAIDLDPKWREMAKTDRDFDAVREDDRFQALMGE
ncbi:MAG: tetratricopeptide repeat protein [Cyanobacteria bacterium CRU_2_1]|nr:tetratricopeptide repeat protein [Cyanobacteria bacterium CRU_2_1]